MGGLLIVCAAAVFWISIYLVDVRGRLREAARIASPLLFLIGFFLTIFGGIMSYNDVQVEQQRIQEEQRAAQMAKERECTEYSGPLR